MNNQSLAPMAMRLAPVPTGKPMVKYSERCELHDRVRGLEKVVTITFELPKGEEPRFRHWSAAVRKWHPGWGLEQVLFKGADVVEMPKVLEVA